MQRPVLAAIAVLVEDDRVLLVRRRNPPDAGLWGFPGGKVEFGETVGEAAVRELEEETGVLAEAGKLLGLVDVIGETERGGHHYVLAAVLCRHLSGSPVAAGDASESVWQPLAGIFEGTVPTSRRVPELTGLALAERRASSAAQRGESSSR